MYYTVLFINTFAKNQEITWMGETFNNVQNAFNHGCDECKKLEETMPKLKFAIVMHKRMWLELDIESEG